MARELHDESIQHWIALDQRLQLATKRLQEQANPELASPSELHPRRCRLESKNCAVCHAVYDPSIWKISALCLPWRCSHVMLRTV